MAKPFLSAQYYMENTRIFVERKGRIMRCRVKNICMLVFMMVCSGKLMFAQKADSVKLLDTLAFLKKEIEISDDNPIVKQIDAALVKFAREYDDFTTDTVVLNVLNHHPKDKPVVSDSVMKARLQVLDDNSPMSLEFNSTVKSYIDLYVNRRRSLVSTMLARKEYFFPMFEEKLAKYKIPQELKYLAIVESALRPDAESWAGAAGLWQFMYTTGKMYDLEVDSYRDDRKDPFLATEAACHHLKDLFDMYNDWELALAAYNSGPGNVNKAIRRAGGKKNFWEIYEYLPRETQGYVPAFIAVNYAMNYASEHNIYPREAKWKFYEMDTIYVSDRIDFKVVSKYLDVEKEDISYLNPHFVHDIIPVCNKSTCFYLPKDKLGAFLANEDSIVHYSLEFKKVYENARYGGEEAGNRIVYRVRSGDYLGKIASRYGCRVSELKKWNKLRSNNLRIGQRLIVYTKKAKKAAPTKSKPKTEKIEGFEYYTIQKGDTLWDIATRFPGVSVDDLRKHNEGLNPSNLKSGTKIKIVKKG